MIVKNVRLNKENYKFIIKYNKNRKTENYYIIKGINLKIVLKKVI